MGGDPDALGISVGWYYLSLSPLYAVPVHNISDRDSQQVATRHMFVSASWHRNSRARRPRWRHTGRLGLDDGADLHVGCAQPGLHLAHHYGAQVRGEETQGPPPRAQP